MISFLRFVAVILALICLVFSALDYKKSENDSERTLKLKKIILITWIVIFIASLFNFIL